MVLPSFAQHMRVLETSNIVLSQKAGRVHHYALAPQALAGAERWMLDQREIWEQRLDRMQDYVEGLATNKEKPMSKVFANIALSLDGYMTPEGMTIDHWDDPGFKNWGAKWGALMSWLIGLEHFRSSLKIGPGGETGPVNEMVRHTSERIGANIMGRRMFEAGERSWPEEAPFHTPVFVLTHNAREPWVRPGGTTFHFVTDGPQSALAQAKAAAGGKDVRIAGGADVVQQYLKLGAVEELEIALAPVLFGGGRRLFENLGDGLRSFQIDRVLHTPLATHLRYLPS